MAIMRRNDKMFPALSNWFDDFFTDDFDLLEKVATVPSVNIKDRKKDYLIEVAVPGMEKDDINIDLDNNVLIISSQKKEEKEEEDGDYTKREFYYNEFRRVFTIPETADPEKIEAELKKGILKIKIAKKPEAQQKPSRKIAIK